MKNSLLTSGRGLGQTALTILLGVGLTAALWIVTLPVAMARLMTPTEMIEAGLPPGIVMKTAGKPQFLTAVCSAVRSHRKSAPAIAKTAVAAHHEYSGDIVATVVRCTHGEEKIDCELTGEIVAAAISSWPDSASVIEDAAVAVAPECADAIQSATTRDGKEVLADVPAEGPDNFGSTPPTNQPPLLGGGGGGGGFTPDVARILVCDNGTQRNVAAPRVSTFLHNHPGSFVGACNITPATSR